MRAPLERPLAHLERLCRDAEDAEKLSESVGAYLARQVEADARVFLVLDPLSALWTTGYQEGHAPEGCAVHREHAFLRSPYADYAHASRIDDRVQCLTRGEAPSDDAYVRHMLEEFGFEQELHVSFAQGGLGYGHLTLSRRDGRFGERSRKLVEQSVGTVTQHLRRLLARDLVASVPGDHVALMIVDTTGKLSAANLAGEALLRSRRDRGDLFQSPISVVAEIARRGLIAPDAPEPPRVTFVDPVTQRRYRMICERLLADGGPPRALLMAEPIRSLDSIDMLKAAGLTEREAEVALVTLRGFRSAEGADTLGISEHTFLSHLKSTYRKLGVASRSELASLLLGAA